MQLIPAIKKDEELVREMDALLPDTGHLYAWWLGQSGFLVQGEGHRLLLDPYLSDSLTAKYADTKKPHTRMSERVIDPALLKNISVVVSTHNHTDHLDAATLEPVLSNNPGIRFVIPEANRAFVAERVNCSIAFPVGLNDGEEAEVAGMQFHGIPAMHNKIERDEQGHCKYMGYVIQIGKWKIYHSGDTLYFPELAGLLRPYAVHLALLPINGNDPARKVAGNLDCREAATLGSAIGAGLVVPCHYDMFTFNTADVSVFAAEADKARQPYKILRGGEFVRIPS